MTLLASTCVSGDRPKKRLRGLLSCSAVLAWPDHENRAQKTTPTSPTTTTTTTMTNGTTTNADTDKCTCAQPNGDDQHVIELRFMTNANAMWIEPWVRAFEASKSAQVRVTLVPVDFLQLYGSIENEAISEIGLYDGFFAPPAVAGSVVSHNGWADLKPYIQETADNLAAWNDILLGYRQNIAQYEDKIIMFPLDGDVLSLFYRKDVLAHYGLSVPRTWEEYTAVAKATHGQVWKDGTVLTGSCVGRVANCAGVYWTNLLLSSMTQTHGAKTGHLFDTLNLQSLAGPALEQALRWSAQQAQYGHENEFGHCAELNAQEMTRGNCVLTYNWGDTFARSIRSDSTIDGKLGVARTPGSTHVLDRESMTLVPCNEERCKYGDYYDDIGWVNRAPYLAFGGWACAVNNYTDNVSKRLATELCAFVSSHSDTYRSNSTATGQDPFRYSQLNVDYYVQRGFERRATQEYLDAVLGGIKSPNSVTDIRFPCAPEIHRVLDAESFALLKSTKSAPPDEGAMTMTPPEMDTEIRRVVSVIEEKWRNVIANYDASVATTSSSMRTTLEQYQRLRGVYTEQVDLNHLGTFRVVGDVLASIIVLSALLLMMWTWMTRGSFVVRASQPQFLFLICIGGIIAGSAIYAFGLDDGSVGELGAARACMAVPWLLAMGWSLLFSALGAKLHRVNTMHENAVQHRRITVSVMEVAAPWAIVSIVNFATLLVWTLIDPAHWNRVSTDDLNSIGMCQYDTGNVTSRICFSIVVVVNGMALLFANFQAWKARHVASEYGESHQIALAMGSILQIVVISVPLLLVVENNPSAQYFLKVSMVFVAVQSILCLIFVPKIQAWARGKKDTESTSRIRRARQESSLRSNFGHRDEHKGNISMDSVATNTSEHELARVKQELRDLQEAYMRKDCSVESSENSLNVSSLLSAQSLETIEEGGCSGATKWSQQTADSTDTPLSCPVRRVTEVSDLSEISESTCASGMLTNGKWMDGVGESVARDIALSAPQRRNSEVPSVPEQSLHSANHGKWSGEERGSDAPLAAPTRRETEFSQESTVHA